MQPEGPARHDAVQECAELVIVQIRHLARRLGRIEQVVHMRHHMQHGGGDDSIGFVEQRDHERLVFVCIQNQSTHQVGSPVAKKAAADHFNGTQTRAQLAGQHVIEPPGDTQRIPRRVSERHRQVGDLQDSLQHPVVYRP
jgi:hypothetical protein